MWTSNLDTERQGCLQQTRIRMRFSYCLGNAHSSSTNHQVEVGSLCECSEIPVSRNERDPGVDTALSNQRVSEACFSFLRQHSGAEPARPLPIAGFDLDQRHIGEGSRCRGGKLRIA